MYVDDTVLVNTSDILNILKELLIAIYTKCFSYIKIGINIDKAKYRFKQT